MTTELMEDNAALTLTERAPMSTSRCETRASALWDTKMVANHARERPFTVKANREDTTPRANAQDVDAPRVLVEGE